MTVIGADQVKALRDATGAGMMDCTKALQEADGDVEKAVEILRQKGLASAQKRAGRTANQGLIKERLYQYMKGPEFHMQIRGITDAFRGMQEDLLRERRAMEKIWKSREKQIETVLLNTAAIQGALAGTMGPHWTGESGLDELEGMGELPEG